MTRLLLLAATAISLIVPAATADAGSRHRHDRHHRASSGPVHQPYGPWQAPAGLQRHGPPWAMPNECFQDEGYGRWSPCGGRDF